MVRALQGAPVLAVTVAPRTIEDLYREEWAGLVRLALAMTGDRGRAEDIVHDVFVRLATRPLPREAHSYLRAMVINAARDHHRRLDVERRHLPSPPPPTMNPELDEMITLLWRLPKRQREVLALRYYADMTIDEIARQMKCPTGTVKSLIHRALEDLRKELAP